MHRSGSASRFADDFYRPGKAQVTPGGSPPYRSSAGAVEMDYRLPSYDPQSDAGKKESSPARLSENLVHLIPLVLLLCALVLWFFSHPGIDVAGKEDSIVARIKNMSIDGYSHWNGSAMTMGHDDLDPIDGLGTARGDPGNNKEERK